MTTEPRTANPYASAVRRNFEALAAAYKDSHASFWELGHSFDTMVDFLDVVDDGTAAEVGAMAVDRFDVSLRALGGFDKAWFDDFGWWSAATARALTKPFFKGNVELRRIQDDCWFRFTDNAPCVWRYRKPNTFDDYAPAVDGGVWNAYWSGPPERYHGPKDGDPSSAGLAGIQNTVTNSIYMLSGFARNALGDGEAVKAALREFEFLETWFADATTPLWWAFADGSALVHERVGHFANGMPAGGFQKDFAWAGDQGLLIGSLIRRQFRIEPNMRNYTQVEQLLAGVRLHMVDGDGVVQSYTTTGRPPDTVNYDTGSGVFWRNYLFALRFDDLRPFLARPEYTSMVRVSADAVANEPTAGEPIDILTNRTAVLAVAYATFAPAPRATGTPAGSPPPASRTGTTAPSSPRSA